MLALLWKTDSRDQGCQVVSFKTKNTSFGIFWRTFGCILWTFGNFLEILYIFSSLWYILSRKIWQPWPG
jgi:hypothetical protein